MRKKKKKKTSFIVAVFMVFLVCSSHLESVAGQVSPAECEDSCSMGCINVDQRLAARCERKCRIKCYPAGVKVEEKNLG